MSGLPDPRLAPPPPLSDQDREIGSSWDGVMMDMRGFMVATLCLVPGPGMWVAMNDGVSNLGAAFAASFSVTVGLQLIGLLVLAARPRVSLRTGSDGIMRVQVSTSLFRTDECPLPQVRALHLLPDEANPQSAYFYFAEGGIFDVHRWQLPAGPVTDAMFRDLLARCRQSIPLKTPSAPRRRSP